MTGNENSPRVADAVIFAQAVVSLTRVEAEALIRFAAEFVCRAKYAPATADGLGGGVCGGGSGGV